jgi:hypothetical protein
VAAVVASGSAGLGGIERGVPVELADGANPPDVRQFDGRLRRCQLALGPPVRVKARVQRDAEALRYMRRSRRERMLSRPG